MTKPNWARELKLCEMLLDRDDRNCKYCNLVIFLVHGWNYRRFIAKNAPTTLQQEFDFTTKKIEKNFSNYSGT